LITVTAHLDVDMLEGRFPLWWSSGASLAPHLSIGKEGKRNVARETIIVVGDVLLENE
jgi:hypothetical protein